MKKSACVLVVGASFIAITLLEACGGRQPPAVPAKAAGVGADLSAPSSAASGTAAETHVETRHARCFTIERLENAMLVSVRNPGQQDFAFRYLLVPRAAEAPRNVEGATVIRVPVERVAALSTPALAVYEQLGVVDRLVAFSTFRFVNTASVLRRIEASKLVEVGDDAQLDVEKLLTARPEVLVTTGLDAAAGLTRADADRFAKVVEAGIPLVMAGDYMEETPLGRAEWIKFHALFFGREKEGAKAFKQMEARYHELSGKARRQSKRPTVLVGNSFRGVWYTPGGRSYIARLIGDAGGEYLWESEDSRGSLRLDFEAVLARGAHADYWINTGLWRSVRDALADDPRYAQFEALDSGRAYNCDRKRNQHGALDYWENGLANPDRLLADLIKIFHPDLLPDHELEWYRPLDRDAP